MSNSFQPCNELFRTIVIFEAVKTGLCRIRPRCHLLARWRLLEGCPSLQLVQYLFENCAMSKMHSVRKKLVHFLKYLPLRRSINNSICVQASAWLAGI